MPTRTQAVEAANSAERVVDAVVEAGRLLGSGAVDTDEGVLVSGRLASVVTHTVQLDDDRRQCVISVRRLDGRTGTLVGTQVVLWPADRHLPVRYGRLSPSGQLAVRDLEGSRYEIGLSPPVWSTDLDDDFSWEDDLGLVTIAPPPAHVEQRGARRYRSADGTVRADLARGAGDVLGLSLRATAASGGPARTVAVRLGGPDSMPALHRLPASDEAGQLAVDVEAAADDASTFVVALPDSVAAEQRPPPQHRVELPSEQVPALLRAAIDPTTDTEYRLEALDLLGLGGRATDAPELLPLLQDPDGEVRSTACRAIGATADARVLPELATTLVRAADLSDLRAAVVAAIAAIGAVEGVPLLVSALSDPLAGVRMTAASGLADIALEHRPTALTSTDVPQAGPIPLGGPPLHIDRDVAVYVEPLPAEAGAPRVRIGVCLLHGSVDAARGLTVILVPSAGSGVTRYGRLPRSGRLVFHDLDPASTSLRIVGPASGHRGATDVRGAGVRFRLTQAAAARGPVDWSQVASWNMSSADGAIEASVILDPLGPRLDLQVRVTGPADAVVSTVVEFPSEEALRLLLPLTFDPRIDRLRGDARLGVPRDEIGVGELELVHPSALDRSWLPVIEESIRRAGFDRDRQAWIGLANRPDVSPELADAIRAMVEDL